VWLRRASGAEGLGIRRYWWLRVVERGWVAEGGEDEFDDHRVLVIQILKEPIGVALAVEQAANGGNTLRPHFHLS
jgi:hypothetical protein